MRARGGARLASQGALAAAVALCCAQASSQDRSTMAEALFKAGQQLLADGKTHEACVKLEESQRLEPALGTLLNLAVCHEQEGRTATAWGEYRTVASDASRSGDHKREKFARDHAAALEKKLHYVVLDVAESASGLEIRIDGQPLGPGAAGAPIPLDPGKHAIEERASKKQPRAIDIAIADSAGSEHIALPKLEDAIEVLAPIPPPSVSATVDPPRPPPPVEDAGGGDQRTAGFIVGGVGVIGLGVGVAFTAVMLGKKADRDSACPPGAPCPSALAYDQAVHADNSARSARTVAFITGGLGIAALAGGAILIATSRKSKTPAPEISLVPIAIGRSNVVGVGGKF